MKDRITGYFKREDVFPYRLKAVYTIEAAAVMGICMVFIGLLFIGGVHLYGSAMDTLCTYERPETRQQEVFRLTRAAAAVLPGDRAAEGK